MFYINGVDKVNKRFGIVDTEDGVEEYYSLEDIKELRKQVEIKGVSKTGVKPINATNLLIKGRIEEFNKQIWSIIQTYSEETCLELAGKGGYKRQIKALNGNIDQIRNLVYEKTTNTSIKDVLVNSQNLTNVYREVDSKNPDAIKQALKSNICFVLQQSVKGNLTAFLCTANLGILDQVFEPMYFDTHFLFKNLYGYTYNIGKVRASRTSDSPRNPDYLTVFSASLRFDREGIKHDGLNKELSSPTYTINLPRVVAVFALCNVKAVGNPILDEYSKAVDKNEYLFDINMYNDIKQSVTSGVNIFENKEKFMSYVDDTTIPEGKSISVDEIMERYKSNFGYMSYLRSTGFSFN